MRTTFNGGRRSGGPWAAALAGGLAVSLAVAAAAAASRDGASASALVKSRSTSLGIVLADAQGRTLYRFKQDSKAGQTKGEKVEAFGGKWYVVSPKGSKIEKPEDSGSSGGGTHGGGYSGGGYGGG